MAGMEIFDLGASFRVIDEQFATAVQEAFEDAQRDCMTRSSIDKTRAVTIKLYLKPRINDTTGRVDGVDVIPELPAPALPKKRRGKAYQLVVNPITGRAEYNPFNPYDAHQGTLFGPENEEEPIARKDHHRGGNE